MHERPAMSTTKQTPIAEMTPAQVEEALHDALWYGCSRRRARAILAALPAARATELDAEFAHHGGFVEHVAI